MKKKSDVISTGVVIIMLVVLITGFTDIFVRGIAKNIVLDKLEIDNGIVQAVVDGLVQEKEGTDIQIDWNELYPYQGKEEAVLQKSNRLETIFNRYISVTDKIEAVIEYYSNDGLRNQTEISRLASEYNNLIGWDLTIADNQLVPVRNGYLPTIVTDRPDITELAKSVIDLNEFTEQRNIELCYIQIPGNTDRNGMDYVGTYQNESNNIADELLLRLRENDIDTLDLREMLYEEGQDYDKFFYRTDMHWTTETAFKAAVSLAEYLERHYGFQNTDDIYQTNLYHQTVFEKSFLGGNGRKVTEAKAEAEDFILISPKYETEYHMEIKSRGMDLEGTFEEVFINYETLTQTSNTNGDPYDSYRTRNYPLITIENLKAERNRDKKILLLRDSFSSPMIPYLAASTGKIDCLFLQTFNGSVETYIEQTKPDIVLIAYYPGNLQDIDWKAENSLFDFR